MNISTYTYLLANPQKITPEDLTELDILVQKYPYFQSARAIQLKGLKNQDSYRYNEALKLAAAHTTDRDILFEYITSEKFIQNEISQTILQHDTSVMEIDVVSEDVSKEIRVEQNKEWQVEREKADAILNPNLFQRKIESLVNFGANDDSASKESNELSEKPLEIDKPLEFTKKDTHSFSEWLKLTKAKPIERSVEAPKQQDAENESSTNSNKEAVLAEEEKERKFELIDKFIQERPKITPIPAPGNTPEPSQKQTVKDSLKDLEAPYPRPTDSLMTETLARVYLQQKNYKKAIQAYKILILKNPEKSGFFADQIRAIEKSINPEAQ